VTREIDVDAPASVASAVVLGTVGVLSFIVQPGLVQGFVTELGLSEVAANDLAFTEMSGVALATVITAALSPRANWRILISVCLVLAAAGNVASAVFAEPGLFRAARFATGLGEGGIISLSFAAVGLTAKTERNLAFYLVLLLTYGALGLWAMPRAFDAIGLSGVFLIWAGLTAASFTTVPFLPASVDSRTQPSATAARVAPALLGVALLGVLVYNTAIGVAWANLFLIGMSVRPDEQAIANALLISQFVAVAGALAALFLAERLDRWGPIALGVLGGAAAIGLLLTKPNYLLFAVAVSAFNFLWNMVLPFILAAVSDMDETGHAMAPAIAMQMIGLGFGPFFAARILGEGGGFAAVETMTITLLIVSLALLAIPMAAQRRALAGRAGPA